MYILYQYMYMEDANVNVVQHKYEASISNYIIKNKKICLWVLVKGLRDWYL